MTIFIVRFVGLVAMKIEIDGPFTITPTDEPAPDDGGDSSDYAVRIFVSVLLLIGLYLRFGG